MLEGKEMEQGKEARVWTEDGENNNIWPSSPQLLELEEKTLLHKNNLKLIQLLNTYNEIS